MQNLTKIYAFSFFRNFSVHAPVFVLFWKGYLTLTEIMILHIVFTLTTIITEIPSGAFADKFGRKYSLAIGGFLYTISMIGFGITPLAVSLGAIPLIWLSIFEAFSGLAFTFTSGADSALIYDKLKKEKKIKEFNKARGESFAYAMLGLAIASLLGGFIAKSGLEKPFFATAMAVFICGTIALTIKEPKTKIGNKVKEKIKKTKEGYFKLQFSAVSFVLKHKKTRWLSLYYALVYSMAFIGIVTFFQLYLKELGIPIEYFGIIYMAIIMSGAAVSLYAHKIEEFLGEKNTIIALPIILGISYILMSKINIWQGAFILIILQAVFSFIIPVLENYAHKHISSNNRTTVISARNTIAGIGVIIFSPMIGVLGDNYSLQFAILISGIITLLLGMILIKFQPR